MAGLTEYAKDVLVETQWVRDHLGDPGTRIVEVDVDTSSYELGHIPGAIAWNWKTQLQDYPGRDLVGKEKFEQLMSQSGISNDTTVILYGDNNNWFAAWAYWQLKYYGHTRARVMYGGRVKWLKEDRTFARDVPSYPSASFKARDPDLSVRAFRDYILQALASHADFGLVDVRSPREFSGELLAPENLPQEGAQRGGHVPGARNIPWSTAVRDDGTFKSPEDLRQIYEAQGITPDKEVIAYCRIGERSSHTWFVLNELLGYPKVRNYDGSWTEWGSLVGSPIER